MRGLTAAERECLSTHDNSVFPWSTYAPLLRDKRIELHDNRTRARNTDLGNLALRVCPVDE